MIFGCGVDKFEKSFLEFFVLLYALINVILIRQSSSTGYRTCGTR